MKILFTSESVTEGHPDKLCDYISDSILDSYLELDPYARVACETVAGKGEIYITGEITSNAEVNIEKVAEPQAPTILANAMPYLFSCSTFRSAQESAITFTFLMMVFSLFLILDLRSP